MPTAAVARRKDAAGVAVAQDRKAYRDGFTQYIGTVLRHLEAHYAADKWDVLMYVVTYVLVFLLFATDIFG
ncbi:hypothetical protein SVA_2299 [Sulfurifustis variabilis]|uniref:Uncharacterized protein n=1 Tax=Sulfurifustis variabilis TaxID=1675686 RepID=A0A1B4V5N3_9GAMM|nr:hypothetical protein [Sulfurifustis variabilis]BAU48849.1 hypothetical protein SVA_2299 [Sulfurifustis variabilis]